MQHLRDHGATCAERRIERAIGIQADGGKPPGCRTSILVDGRGHQAGGHIWPFGWRADRVALRGGTQVDQHVTHAAERGSRVPFALYRASRMSLCPLEPAAVPTSTIAPLGWTRTLLPAGVAGGHPGGRNGRDAIPLVPNDRSRVPLAR